MPGDPFTSLNFENKGPTEEELSYRAARQEVYELGDALEPAQQEFDNMNIEYHQAHDTHRVLFPRRKLNDSNRI